jgi:hypothetical protein
MPSYYIVCATKSEVGTGNDKHKHVSSVGVRSDTKATTPDHIWTVDRAIEEMAAGKTFESYGKNSKKTAKVSKRTCSRCSKPFIESSPDSTDDDNLLVMGSCA